MAELVNEVDWTARTTVRAKASVIVFSCRALARTFFSSSTHDNLITNDLRGQHCSEFSIFPIGSTDRKTEF